MATSIPQRSAAELEEMNASMWACREATSRRWYPLRTQRERALIERVGLRACLSISISTAAEPRAGWTATLSPYMSPDPTPASRWFLAPLLPAADAFAGWYHHSTIFQCERCEAHHDATFELVDAPEHWSVPMSFVHCRRNDGDGCMDNASAAWKSRQLEVERQKKEALETVKDLVQKASSSVMGSYLGRSYLGDGPPGFLEGYRGWRKLWHCTTLRPVGVEEFPAGVQELGFMIPNLDDLIGGLQLWGDILNDYMMFRREQLTEKQMLYAYELETSSVGFMIRRYDEWIDECQILNDYAARRRSLGTKQFQVAKSAMQRAAVAMKKFVQAYGTVVEATMCGHSADLLHDQEMTARRRFQEISSAMNTDPEQLLFRASNMPRRFRYGYRPNSTFACQRRLQSPRSQVHEGTVDEVQGVLRDRLRDLGWVFRHSLT